MTSQFKYWGTSFPETTLSASMSRLVEQFKLENDSKYYPNVEVSACPFLRDTAIVGLTRQGVRLATPSYFIVDQNGVSPLLSRIEEVCRLGDDNIIISSETVRYYASFVPDSLAHGIGETVQEPRDVESLREAGLNVDDLIDIISISRGFQVTTYFLDREDIAVKMTFEINAQRGIIENTDVETTGLKASPVDYLL